MLQAFSSLGGTVASTVARKHKNTKSGISRSGGREFLDFYDPYAARMPGRMTP